MEPRDRDVIIHDGHILLEGWSYSGGGNWVERVEVSPDGSVSMCLTIYFFTYVRIQWSRLVRR